MHKKILASLAVMMSVIPIHGPIVKSRPLRPNSLFAYSQKTRDVVFGPPRTYEHKSGWFSIAAPENWTFNDKSAEGEVIVSMADPTQNAVLVVRVYQPTNGKTQSELGELLKTYLNERLSGFDGFTTGELKSQRDGSLGLYFKYNSIVEGQSYKMYGDAFIEQHNGLIGLVALIMPQDQYDAKKDAAYGIVNSFRITGSAP